MIDAKKRTLITLGILFAMTLIFNFGLTLSNPNLLEQVAEPSSFELARNSDTIRTNMVVLFGIHDLYDAQHLTITPEAAAKGGINEAVIERYNDRLKLTYTVTSLQKPDIQIGPDAVIYERPNKVPIIFLPSDRSRLLVFMHENHIIVMGDES